MKSKTIKSTIVVLMLLSIFTGLAAAIDDIYLEAEEDLLPDKKIDIPDDSYIFLPYGSSDIYHANIDTDEDIDWCKADCISGDHFVIFIDGGAYNAYVAYYSEDEDGNVVVSYGKKFTEGYFTDGDGDILNPPLFIKFVNRDLEPYPDYQFFVVRSK